MDQIKDGWFYEKNDLWPGQTTALEVEEILYSGKSEYQDILVIKTTNHGVSLILDGIIQCTESDEFAYQEMISFLPLCAHPNPSRVLIVGGGDGGVAREVSKHPCVKEIVQVEIDAQVVEISKRFLPHMSAGFKSPKLQLHIGDGFEYMRAHSHHFDIVITDSSDPVGPATALFTDSYFELVRRALRAGGVACSQAGTIWAAGTQEVAATLDHCRRHFAMARFATASVPTYPCGQIGFIVAMVDAGLDPINVAGTESGQAPDGLKYYNDGVRQAAFQLPNFVKDILDS